MPPVITSTHNPRFRQALALRDGRERRRRGEMIVDGAREIGRALARGVHVAELWTAPGVGVEREPVIASALASGAAVVEASPEILARLAYGDRETGLVAVAVAPPTGLEHLVLPEGALVGVVERVEKPGNLGAIVRSADGAGVDALIVADPASDPWNPNAIRASLGTVFTMQIAVAPTEEVLAWLRRAGIHLFAARVDGSLAYTQADLAGPAALVLGSEALGLSDAWRAPDVTAIRLPMLGQADSLNVAAAAAVLLYEARRQRAARLRRSPAPPP
jgi:TrmH family RNA methyltransferase